MTSSLVWQLGTRSIGRTSKPMPPLSKKRPLRPRSRSVVDSGFRIYRSAVTQSTTSTTSSTSDVKLQANSVIRNYEDDPEQRVSILNDLQDSEKGYVEQLNQLRKIYILPMSQPIQMGPGGQHFFEIPEDERRAVFSDIRNIINYHTVDICPTITMIIRQMKAMGHDTDGVWSKRATYEIAEVFNSRANELRDYYIAYGRGVWDAILTTDLWVEPPGNPSGHELWVEEFCHERKKNPEHELGSLAQYLEHPLKHLNHYELFLKHLARHTPPQSHRNDPLDMAYKFISSLGTQVSQARRFAQLRSQLRPDHSVTFINQALASKSPDLIMEGPFTLVRYLTRESISIVRDHIMIDNEELLFPGERKETLDTIYYQHNHTELNGQTLLGVLLSDRLVLLADSDEENVDFCTFAILRMNEIKDNLKVCGLGKAYMRIVCGHSAYYLDTGSRDNAKQWLDEMETVRRDHQAERQIEHNSLRNRESGSATSP
ncbi:hypothetical protein L804_03043 [Cryptococcus deuterogattii 2001/935-1]|nr:hypothetical protein L804_03043 [Cryptococcus deuterogattii 2001/935-1]